MARVSHADNSYIGLGGLNINKPLPRYAVDVLTALRDGPVNGMTEFEQFVARIGSSTATVRQWLNVIAIAGLIRYNSLGTIRVSITPLGVRLLAPSSGPKGA